ncbi:hypothetical protein AWV80_33540 [Cupriavidus sp. UYMU48A]|nr:hypothetical protein AWV80_33540 [Cupriavidus sp. UYMU48A]
MAWLRNLGIGTRLSLAFLLVVLLLIGVAAFGLTSLAGVNASMHQTVEGRLFKVIDLGHVKENALQIGVMVRDAALTEDPALVQQNTQRIDGMRKEMKGTLDALGKLMAASGRADLQKIFSDLTAARETYNGQLDVVLRQLGAGEFAGARAGLVVTLPAAQGPYFEKLDEIMASGRDLAVAAVKQADDGFVWTRNVLLGLTALAVLLAVVMGTAITRSITGPAREALEAAEALATGNLRHAFKVRSSDEMGRMLAALERGFRHLAALVHGIQQASGSIDGARAKSPVATPTCPSARSSRLPRWSRPQPRWNSSRPPCARMPTTRGRLTSLPSMHRTWPPKAGASCATWCRPWTASPSRPRRWRTSPA